MLFGMIVLFDCTVVDPPVNDGIDVLLDCESADGLILLFVMLFSYKISSSASCLIEHSSHVDKPIYSTSLKNGLTRKGSSSDTNLVDVWVLTEIVIAARAQTRATYSGALSGKLLQDFRLCRRVLPNVCRIESHSREVVSCSSLTLFGAFSSRPVADNVLAPSTVCAGFEFEPIVLR